MLGGKDQQLKEGSRTVVWNMMGPLVRPLFGWMGLVLLLSFVVAALGVSEPYIYGRIVDSMTVSVGEQRSVEEGLRELIPYLVAWVSVVLGSMGLTAVVSWLAWYVGNRLERGSLVCVYEQLLRLSVGRFQSEKSGAILGKFKAGTEAVWMLNTYILRTLFPSFVTLVMVMGLGLFISWKLMIAVLLVIPLNIVVALVNAKVTNKKQDEIMEEWDKAMGLVGDAFLNITSVQGNAGEDRGVRAFRARHDKTFQIQMKLNYLWSILEAFGSGFTLIGRLVVFCAGGYLVLRREMTLGTLVMFLGLSGTVYGTVQYFLNIIPEFLRQWSRLERLSRLFAEVPEIQNHSRAKKAKVFKGEITFDQVSFCYPDQKKPVLQSVNFTVPEGKTYALVGESGAGKSTLVKLLPRFADPTSGAVRIDGVDLRDMTLSSLRPQIGFVMQENLLFHDTVLNNIRFGRPNASLKEVVQAAKRAQAHEFISKLPEGYKTVVGERGVKLSGGQKQRVALARVLLSNPPILVLDEATSALDSKTEHDLQKALREVMKGRTTIVIAHRLSTVMDADRILVMDKGRVVDEGVHEDLIKRDNLYKRFWEIQAGGYL